MTLYAEFGVQPGSSDNNNAGDVVALEDEEQRLCDSVPTVSANDAPCKLGAMQVAHLYGPVSVRGFLYDLYKPYKRLY